MLVECVLFVVLLYTLYKISTPARPKNFPPGPRSYPVVGGMLYIQSIDPDAAIAVMKLGEIFGPVSGFRLGKRWCIAVNGYAAVKEVLSHNDFADRPKIFTINQLWNYRSMGIFFGNGEAWKEQRRFALRNLRDFGFGKASMEAIFHEEVTDCIRYVNAQIKKSANSSVALHELFAVPVLNVLWTITSGKRISRNDMKMMGVLKKIRDSFRSLDALDFAINEYPSLRFVPILSTKFKIFNKGARAVKDILYKEINEHEKERDVTYSRDFIDVYLKEIQEEKDKGNTKTSFTTDQCAAVVSDLFNAGAESTSNTISFAILYTLLHPEVRNKLQKELDDIVGKDRLPSLNDRPNLHYTEAVMTEALRMSSIAPLSVPRCNSERDAKLLGYDIPKNTMVMINLYSVHMEKSFWGDPDIFRPERFLDSDGKFVKPERILSFGFGKRTCVGEPIAKMGYYIFFTAFMQNFELELVPGTQKPITDPVLGVTISPKPFEAIVTSRV